MGLFADKWKSYAEKCCPAKPDSIQYKQTQCEFYAGASVVMGAVNAAGQEDVKEEAAMWLIGSIEMEIHEFMDNLLAEGRRRRESN